MAKEDPFPEYPTSKKVIHQLDDECLASKSGPVISHHLSEEELKNLRRERRR